MASKKPVIAVVGATGAQGSGLIRAILQDPERRFIARAITRKPDSEKARALAALLALAACAPLPRLEAPEVVSVAVLNVEVRLPTIRVDTVEQPHAPVTQYQRP